MNIGMQGVPGWKHGKNIMSLDVPPELDDTITLPAKHRMSWFNQVMGGEGLTPSQVVFFTGDPGIGKTTTLLQLADALHGEGRCAVSGKRVIVIYNTAEESLFQVRRTMRRVELKKGFIAGQDSKLDALLQHVDQVQAANPNARVVVIQDSLQTLDDGHYKDGGITSGTNMRCMEAIVKHAKEKWSTWIVIGHVTKGGNAAGKNSIVHTGDAHVTFHFDRAKKSATHGERLIGTTKNRFGSAGCMYVLGMAKDGIFSKGSLAEVTDSLSDMETSEDD